MAKKRRSEAAPVGGGSVRAQVERWLKDSGNYTSVQSQPGMVFMVVGRFPKLVPPPGQPMPFFVIQPDDDHSVVAVLTNVTFSPDHRQLLAQLPEIEKQQFLRELQLGLLFRCEYTFQQDPQTKEYLGVQLVHPIYLDAPLTKETLMKAIWIVFHAYLFISMKFQGLAPVAVVSP